MGGNGSDEGTSRSFYNRATMQRRIRININKSLSARSSLGWSLLLLVVALNLYKTTSALSSDGLALVALRNAITSDPKNTLGNWNASDATPCAWSGVTCDNNQRVVKVFLSRKRLVGQIPAEMGNLTYLQNLNLHTNVLFGPLPPQLFNASALRFIYCFRNNLSGSLSPFLGQLTQLQHIDISNNGFVGAIPVEISNLQNLSQINLSGNSFSGPIPEGLGNSLHRLQTIDFSSNQLTGGIPEDLGNLSSLQGVLELSQNHLSGSIPASLAYLPTAVSIDVRANNLSGPIPSIFADQHRVIEADQNEGLCGAPLSNPCPSSLTPEGAPPPAQKARRGLSKGAIIAIVVGDVGTILLVVIIFECCLRTKISCLRQSAKKSREGAATNNSSEDTSFSNSSNQEVQAWCICCVKSTKLGSEASEKIEPGELIRLDKDVKFDLEELLRASAYILGKSSSGSGMVYKAMLEGGMTVAVRRLGEGGAQEYKEFESEVKLIGKIRHPNIVSLRAYYWAVDEKLLVYDFIPNGTLAMALHEPTTEPLNWAKRLRIAQGCGRGLAYIHACGVGRSKLVHKDIKPSNILLDANLEAKISDLGLPRLQSLAAGRMSKSRATPPEGFGNVLPRTSNLSSHDEEFENIPGRRDLRISHLTSPSSYYYPPESVSDKKQKPTQAWDVYSFGVLLLELLTGRSPAMLMGSGDTEKDVVSLVRQTVEERKPITEVLDIHISTELAINRDLQQEFQETLRIALECTNDVPENRPPLSEAATRLDQIGMKLEISFSD